ncbi:DUF2922 domain-containing protein [Lacticaseibacillus saniviri]|uniref:DUF2922 domain-containing protein n=1 Tax=Lacticaseibacillus saniviri TaxID=931533 RepID=UPI001EE01AED|nr:DUF2922 domain-containing protein [Lacticaseibacillus saniviri]MCG4282491.1 DUF2922 domain-containing protein [Lacticaseibacillus saniviri]
MKQLIFTFKSSDNKTKTIRLSAFSGPLDPQGAQNFLETLVATDIVRKNGVSYFTQPVSAKIVTTTTDTIYKAAEEE